jgi:hypothetical protein
LVIFYSFLTVKEEEGGKKEIINFELFIMIESLCVLRAQIEGTQCYPNVSLKKANLAYAFPTDKSFEKRPCNDVVAK